MIPQVTDGQISIIDEKRFSSSAGYCVLTPASSRRGVIYHRAVCQGAEILLETRRCGAGDTLSFGRCLGNRMHICSIY